MKIKIILITFSFQENFELHKDAKERYHAMTKLLMKQSECSIPVLQANVEEVENYWEELYKRLRILKDSGCQPIEEKVDIHFYEYICMHNQTSLQQINLK